MLLISLYQLTPNKYQLAPCWGRLRHFGLLDKITSQKILVLVRDYIYCHINKRMTNKESCHIELYIKCLPKRQDRKT